MPDLKALQVRHRNLRRAAEVIVNLDPESPTFWDQFRVARENLRAALEQRGKPGRLAGLHLGRHRGHETRHKQAIEFREQVRPVIKEIRANGINSYRGIAEELNKRGIKPALGQRWGPSSVRNVELGGA